MPETTEYQDVLEVDKLKLYLGHDYQVTKDICIKQPTIGEIAEFGEKTYYDMIYSLCGIPSDCKSQLWDIGIDWNKISDFECFILFTRKLDASKTRLVLGDLDLSKFEVGQSKLNGLPILYKHRDTSEPKQEHSVSVLARMMSKFSPPENTQPVQETMDDYIVIDELLYTRIVTYLRAMHGIVPKVEKAANKFTRDFLIEEDRQRIRMKQQHRKGGESVLLPLVSSMVNSAEFKYNAQELKDIGIYQFMDSVQRIQVIRSADALMKGIYGGMVSAKDIPKEDLNWLKNLN